MLLTILLVLSILLNVILIYGVRNVLNKNELLEMNLINSYSALRTAYKDMQEMDSLGAFEADDEVGTTFKAIFSIIEDLVAFLGVEEEDVII